VRGVPATLPHVPADPVILQNWHDPVHAELQHTPSAQIVLRHSEPAVHDWPVFFLQAPIASQLCVAPPQLSSSALVTATHVPPPPVHAWHVPHTLAVQQRPSTHDPDAHSAPAAQVCPGVFLQAPVASHVIVPVQVLSVADLTGEHVPGVAVRLQATQAPAQASLQQTPSTQLPLPHSSTAAHVMPLPFFATHTPARQ
jgi:hypothetical protein